MSRLPYPPASAILLNPENAGTNRSLLLDRGFGAYGPRWDVAAGGEFEFLSGFCSTFARSGGDFPYFVERRHKALADATGARCVTLATNTRLVAGLGLPQPLKAGFLLDRLSGCPYLPGSTIKGLLRAAAGLVATGELEVESPGGAREFWEQHLGALFGPEIAGNAEPARGLAIFHDAFPTAWPRLEVDVLTPHHHTYYEGGESDALPGDWEDPVPVAFLTVAAGTRFNFYLESRRRQQAEGDLDRLTALLGLALDWLGVGGKKAAGHGTFEVPRERAAQLVPASTDCPSPARLPKDSGRRGQLLRKTGVG